MTAIGLEMGEGFSYLARILLWPTGAELRLLSQCPDREVSQLKLTGLLMWLIFATQSVVYACIAAELLGVGINPVMLLGGCVMATFILLSDSALVMHGSFYRQGVAALELGGLPMSNSLGSRIQGNLVVAIRLLVAGANSLLTTGLISLLIFSGDIETELHKGFVAANQAIVTAATTMVDTALQNNRAQQTVLQQRIGDLTKEEATLRAATIDPTVSDPIAKLQLDLVLRLVDAKAAADREVTDAQDAATRELAGAKGPGLSGVAGYGPMRIAADERVANAVIRAQDAARELAAAQKRLAEMQGSIDQATGSKRSEAQLRLSQVMANRQAAEAALAKLDTEYRALSANRERAIEEAVEKDPAFIPTENGLLAKASALSELMRNFHVAILVILMEIVFFTLEISAVLARILSTSPSTYAILLAQEAYEKATMSARETYDRINALDGPGNAGGSAPLTIDGSIDHAPEADKGTSGSGEPAPKPSQPPTLGPLGSFMAGRDAKRGRGRPPGSKNQPKNTSDAKDPPPPSGKPPGDNDRGDDEGDEG